MTDSASALDKIPVWVLGVAIVAVIVLATLLYLSGKSFGCSKSSTSFSCGFAQEPAFTSESFFGYYYDWDEKRNSVCTEEVLTLGFSDAGLIRGNSSANVKDRFGGTSVNTWIHTGFRFGDNIAAAYTTDRRRRTGNGVYYLMKSEDENAGFWVGISSPSGKTIRCPYVLTKTQKPPNESCESRWPKLFSVANECKELDLEK